MSVAAATSLKIEEIVAEPCGPSRTIGNTASREGAAAADCATHNERAKTIARTGEAMPVRHGTRKLDKAGRVAREVAAAAVIVLFGVACAKPCAASDVERARIERDVVRVLTERGYTVKPAPETARRPTGETASPEARDEAKELDADRILVLDLEANERLLWLTHFVRGVPGAWSIGQAVCARENGKLDPPADPGGGGSPGRREDGAQSSGSLQCPELENVVARGLRVRRAEDVDLVSALRFQARMVGACIKADDEAPIDERIFGRVEMDLVAEPTGEVKVRAIAPALVARAPLGKCLRAAMEAMNVGPFEGEPLKLRIPIDLD